MQRKSITPPPQKDWKDNISNAIDQEMDEFNDLDDSQQKRIRIILRQKINYALERDYYKSKAEELKYDKVVIENFARKVACPTRLRYSIETFSKNFVFSIDDMNRRISDLNTKMVAALDSSRRVTNLVNFVRQFASLTSKSEDDQNSKFPAVWKRLKSELPKLIKPQNPTDLQKIIIELYEAANESIAKQTWLNNVKVWKTKLGELTFEDLTTVKDLASIGEEDIREKIEQGDFDKIFKNEYEKEYVLDLLKLRKIGTDLPSMYKICFWILHVSVDKEVEKMRKKISGEWPGEIRAVRYDYYCTKVVELYNLVSELSKHGPGLIPPLNCKPTITDFHEYLKQLSSIGGKSLAFVAETLYVNEK